MEGAEHMAGMIPLEPLPQLQHWQATYSDLQVSISRPSLTSKISFLTCKAL